MFRLNFMVILDLFEESFASLLMSPVEEGFFLTAPFLAISRACSVFFGRIQDYLTEFVSEDYITGYLNAD